jgi:hypothetical protein
LTIWRLMLAYLFLSNHNNVVLNLQVVSLINLPSITSINLGENVLTEPGYFLFPLSFSLHLVVRWLRRSSQAPQRIMWKLTCFRTKISTSKPFNRHECYSQLLL